MPDQNKYEIRSQEVQEVLSTPPRFLTRWGNPLVTLVLALGLICLSRYKVTQTIRLPVQISEANDKLALMVDFSFSDQIEVNQKIKLKTKRGNVFFEGIIVEKIDTTINRSHKLFLLLAENSSNNLPDKIAMIEPINGEAEIQTGKHSLMNHFTKK